MADELIDPAAAPAPASAPASAPAAAPSPAPAPAIDPASAPAPDWRAPIAESLGKDYDPKKLGDFLTRFDSVDALAKKALEQEKLIASGAHKLKAPPGKDASPEVLAEYRKANGIPDTADA